MHLFVKLLLIAIFELNSCSPQSESSSIRLEPLGQVSIPHNHIFEETPIGGLSGLAYDAETDIYYVISDDRSKLSNARFYSFKIDLNSEGELIEGGIQFQAKHYLLMPGGEPYPEEEVDPEGIAFADDSLIYVSSEGVPGENVAPFINAYKKSGACARALPLPEAYWPKSDSVRKGQGVRNNLGFEGLTISLDRKRLYGGTENALMQDGPPADPDTGSPSRLIVYDTSSGKVLHEYCYMVDPVHVSSSAANGFKVNGLTALLALSNEGHLLSLERNYVAGQGNRVSLYTVNTQDATDIKGFENLQQLTEPLKPVKKQLVAHLNDFDITIDNFEGLVLGPALADGGRLLLMVSDNNFSASQQTLFTAFRIEGV